MGRKKIAYIIDGDIATRKGLVNSTLNRVKHLTTIADYQIDVYSIQDYYGWLTRTITKWPQKEKIEYCDVEGIRIHLMWRNFSLFNFFLSVKLHLPSIGEQRVYKLFSKRLKGYDLISAHSLECGEVAFYAMQREGIPFVASWYGTDIHTSPFRSSSIKKRTINIIEKARINFFVSKNLLEISDKLTRKAKKELLYVGIRDRFLKYSEEKRNIIRKTYNVGEKKVVAFAGNLIEVKNPQLLPDIFQRVSDKYYGQVIFWIMGDGKLRNFVEEKCNSYNLAAHFWGYAEDSILPDLFNCVDVFVLPSRNEGLPLITVEALSCGANVVGANVGGIPEVVGNENVFDHGPEFIEQISDRIVYFLQNHVIQPANPCFSWSETAKRENEVYQSLML